jgi:hypothetical protein
MVSVIIVNFNGEVMIGDCVNALRKQTYDDFEIIIVDNASSDNSLKAIHQFLHETPISVPVKIIPLSTNVGFAGGNIEGLQHASGNYIALLNNDTEPDEIWLEELARGLDEHSNVGICASKLICHNSNNVDSAGDGFSKMLKGFKIGEGESSENFDHKKNVFGACAGAALYKRKMLEQIGFLDNDFFLIHEDTDLNFRAQLAGWKVLYIPTAVVYHKVRSSIGPMSDLAVYYSLRNSELVRLKSVPFVVFLKCFPEVLLGFISEFIYFVLRHRRLKLFIKAKRDVIKMLPSIWQKRKDIMKTRKASNAYLLSIMTPILRIEFFKSKLNKLLYG